MGLDIKNTLRPEVTLVSNEFIDRHMMGANGEYVKVYLYLLLHGEEISDLSEVADALNHTEADIKRAITYWEKLGVLKTTAQKLVEPVKQQTVVIPITKARTSCSPEQLSMLAKDEAFSQLIYIAEQYMQKTLTPMDCEIFAYLYKDLKMNAELLEYVIEYCVQAKHNNLRYIEKVALDWHKKGISSVDDAKNRVVHQTKDMFAVMKAFGLQDRKAGTSEIEYMNRWFQDYGFTKEIVLEACRRTLAARSNPNFPYTDGILSAWFKAGVKRMDDIHELDRAKTQKMAENNKGQTAGRSNRGSKNQFHNFEQRDTNYDALVLERLKERLEES